MRDGTLALLGTKFTGVTPALPGHQAAAAVSLANVLRFGNGAFTGLETCEAEALARVLRERNNDKLTCRTLHSLGRIMSRTFTNVYALNLSLAWFFSSIKSLKGSKKLKKVKKSQSLCWQHCLTASVAMLCGLLVYQYQK